MSEVNQERVTIYRARRLPRNWSLRQTMLFALIASATLWAAIMALMFYL